MLTLLSPAKTLDFDFPIDGLPTTEPNFQEDIQVLFELCKQLGVASLEELMALSQSLAELNH